MINSDQNELIKSTKSAYNVTEKRVDPRSIEPLGYCTTTEKGYEIVIKKDLDQDVEDTVRIHEHGHIYLGHMDIDNKEALDEIQETYNRIYKNKAILPLSTRHAILNICMDIEINSQYLSIEQLKLMYGFAYRLCTANSYDCDPGLRYYEYYEPVLKKEKIIEMAKAGVYTPSGISEAFGSSSESGSGSGDGSGSGSGDGSGEGSGS